jgi:multidrug transporter EmrE-like cation transporter
MGMLTIALTVAIASNVLYHLAQKSVPGGLHPIPSLLMTYLAALLVTLLLWPVYPGAAPSLKAFSQVNWASVAVGVAIVGVEIGVLLAYRAGLRISLGATLINVALALILIPIGLLFFRENLSAANVAGLVLCLAGLWLLM